MAGRTTYKGRRHPTREGAIVGPSGDARAELIDECMHLMAIENEAPHMQDVRRTLAAMEKLDGGALLQAMNRCDELTAGLLRRARYLNPSVPVADLPGIAAALVQSDAGGRPRKEYLRHAARGALALWIAQGETDTAVWTTADGSGRNSPLLTFTIALLDDIEGGTFDPRQAARLIRSALEEREGFRP